MGIINSDSVKINACTELTNRDKKNCSRFLNKTKLEEDLMMANGRSFFSLSNLEKYKLAVPT